mmetsp:Transcript_7236/g.18049  ORF Transcript_7236/g.18049 Transcript_7236/m.18049 type:complete len:560 (-) Transcript_7236:307-1986(-)
MTSIVQAKVCPGGEIDGPMTRLIGCNLDFVYIFESKTIDAEALKESLRMVLNHYPMLAGRAKMGPKGPDRIALNNAGVPFIEVQAPGMARTVPALPPRSAYCDVPEVYDQAEREGPLMTVKLTTFSGGGCTLGVVMNHFAVDAWTFGMFVRDWSRIHGGMDIEPVVYKVPDALNSKLEVCATEAQASMFAEGLGLCKEAGLQHPTIPPGYEPHRWLLNVPSFVRKCFALVNLLDGDDSDGPYTWTVLRFEPEALQRLKAEAEAKAGTWITTNEALLASLWTALLDVFEVSDEHRSRSGALVVVNLRGKVDGAAAQLAGNLATCINLRVNLSSLNVAAEHAIHKCMRSILSETQLVQKVKLDEYFRKNPGFANLWADPHGVVYGSAVPGVIGQWNNQAANPYYDVDFGTGGPDRGIPWFYRGEPLKVVPAAKGGMEVLVYHGEGSNGLATWIKPQDAPWHPRAAWLIRTPKRLGISLGLLGVVAAVGGLKRWSVGDRGHRASLGLGLGLMLLGWVCANRVCLSRWQLQALFSKLENHPSLRGQGISAALVTDGSQSRKYT